MTKTKEKTEYLTRDNDTDRLANYLCYYLSETCEDITDWDLEHLSLNILGELKIVKPKWWDKRTK